MTAPRTSDDPGKNEPAAWSDKTVDELIRRLRAACVREERMVDKVRSAARKKPPKAPPPPPIHRLQVNFTASEELVRALVERAEAGGTTQKQIIMRALLAAGLPVDGQDLQDRPTHPRRRGIAWSDEVLSELAHHLLAAGITEERLLDAVRDAARARRNRQKPLMNGSSLPEGD